ncbi:MULTISPECIES: hypothetical protein [Enterococcus]|uniref:Uncharacterized protein n=1 Tax=Enterococcus mundtii TaxID=53346 RepID=A0A2S7RP40_ENTMU|nr:hypothetical protein [Enterococcus mundtii]MBO1085741.1 hypothetical protein [Enterococcus mundtii]MDB7100837.1 hypothetical protein [Enterococcus mundtii]PQF21012.1 hypothetical protein CUS89_14060 [Enterococcus mundtii]PTO36646.1 hypothetical protein C6P52_13620 [Enterococcus mundtii]STD24842.1 Uncharacterised protein [Enterococcus mundtii]
MSVGLFKYNGDIYEENSEVILSENISSQSFYERYWEKAIGELGIKYIQDGAEFNNTKLEVVMEELDLLKSWAIANLQGEEKEYMTARIENLEEVIPKSLISKKDILYIF